MKAFAIHSILETLLIGVTILFGTACTCDPTAWPDIKPENRPGLRWWWLGSAVDEANIDFQMEEFAAKGFGTVEITPLYGVQGNEEKDIEYLSPRWMEILSHCIAKGHSLGIEVDMSNCTGWPFGGPWIEKENAAKTYAFNADTTRIFAIPTAQMVKRAAPGGEGLVMDHFSRKALDVYLAPFDSAFGKSLCPWPDAFFDDSYEVYHAGWTDEFPDAFFNDHGYRIEDYLKAFARNDGSAESERVIADYRETISNLYMRNFVIPWEEWCRSKGAIARHQAHGAPANILDVYAAADIPECEDFGQTPFDIKGLHRSGEYKANSSDRAAFKFASSAAHITGKPLASCETLTWLTDHFHTSLSLCKPEIDLALASGINHVMLHGAPYSPRNVDFPGWKFYATINLSPSNPSIWEVSKPLSDYISRCQAFLSEGKPDADFLLYFPIYDIWHTQFQTPLMMLDIHRMNLTMPVFKQDVNDILSMGYDVDYISDALLESVEVGRDGLLHAPGGTIYKALVLPSQTTHMPHATRARIEEIRASGGRVFTKDELSLCEVRSEKAMNLPGVHMIRRTDGKGAFRYFIANLGPDDLDYITLSCDASAVEILDPMTSKRGFAQIQTTEEGTKVRVFLKSGSSVLLRTFSKRPTRSSCGDWRYFEPSDTVALDGPWALDFPRSFPSMPQVHYDLDSLKGWHILPGGDITEAVGIYSTDFDVSSDCSTRECVLALSEVRESAVVRVNGVEVGTLIAVPFEISIGEYLKPGTNHLEIEVRNLPANRIAQMDRDGKIWRIFKDVNIAHVVSYRVEDHKDDYSWWPVVPSGLIGPVYLLIK